MIELLHEEIENIEDNDYYPTSDELTMDASEEVVTPLLAKAILWLINKKAFDTAVQYIK